MRLEPFVSYAQNREDVVLARALRPDERSGFWVDVGAGDPVTMSVTAAFAERGWHGVNIEPLRYEYERLCEARPSDRNLRLALAATPGRGKFFAAGPAYRGASTMVPEVAERYRREGHEFQPIEVTVSTLADIAAEYVAGPVDFLKVDVEGFEREVLAGADWSCFKPRVVVVEATAPNSTTPTHEEWEPMLIEVGYRFALFDGLNRFYARSDEPELVEALATPANVLDNFITYDWLQVREDAARAGAAARYAQDETAAANECIAVLRGDLAAAQLRGSQALAELQALHENVEILEATRTYRHVRAIQRIFDQTRRYTRFFR